MRKRMSFMAVIGIAILFMSCQNVNDDIQFNLYWKFQHVKEIVDEQTENMSFELSDEKLSIKEIDSLTKILKERRWDFYVTTDSSILVKKLTDDITGDLKSLDDELYTRMGDTTFNRTFYR